MIKRAITALSAAALMMAAAAAQGSEFYPVELIKPGLKGVGKTIFQGTTIEEFDAEILGVLENFGPDQDLILARLSGHKIERTGVFGGMSGSPVYVDGRLVGAVAFSFAFSTEPIAGITPIHEMVDIFKSKPPRERRIAAGRGRADPGRIHEAQSGRWGDRLEASRPSVELDASSGFGVEGTLRPISTPLSLSGFSPRAIRDFAPRLRAAGLTPVRGLVTAASNDYPEQPLQPGSTVTVQMVRGDIDVSAGGTVTHVAGDKVYAFGHPFLGIGDTSMPLNQGAVVAVIPSLQNSNKVTATVKPVGALRQDRSTAIYGVKEALPSMIPVTIKLETSRNDLKEYNLEIVNDRFLTPFLINFTVNNVIVSSERSLGEQTLRVKCDVSLKGYPNVVYESNIAGKSSTPALASVTLSAPVAVLLDSGFEDLEIERLDFEVAAVEQVRMAEVMRVWQDKLEAEPGEEVRLKLFLRREDGTIDVESHPVKIPEGLPSGAVKIAVGDGLSLSRADRPADGPGFVPKDLGQLVKAINNLKTNDRLYVRLFREQSGAVIGDEGMPALPPSMLALYKSRKTPEAVRSIDKVVFFEYELPPRDYVLSGRKVVEVDVK